MLGKIEFKDPLFNEYDFYHQAPQTDLDAWMSLIKQCNLKHKIDNHATHSEHGVTGWNIFLKIEYESNSITLKFYGGKLING